MKFGVLVFPGSNCDYDCFHLAAGVLGAQAKMIWHEDPVLDVDAVMVPGGFSYGDYLRCGAIAKFSRVMESLQNFSGQGKPVIGICNGFQILTESGLLPGTLLRNRDMKFICKDVYLRVESNHSIFSRGLTSGEVLRIPIAHGEGNYFVDETTLKTMQSNGQIIFRYCSQTGERGGEFNPNGALDDIAGVSNAAGNVLGMMPHPERCAEAILGNRDGLKLFQSLVQNSPVLA